ncbi:DUF2934 domain-containing protein [Azospirillum rugosum]|uniref:DUF2934 domain-containing protein n=1 Tax=Azospirillum rugosum TaxID=416170 RepID=A0ABS4SEA1_9PROT|nr:DUF2934 domain-containing protein [Azospirillum rugosum]MBP2290393.1 hypothetical protein [Azospirillum rugosum]MDQ0527869.1 hypothetical protein [Azospirillum rugosum]
MDENRIRQRAYEIWEQEGRPEGRHAENWERACRELGNGDAATQATPHPEEAMDANVVSGSGNLGRAAEGMMGIENEPQDGRRGAEDRAPGAAEEAGGGA